MRFVGMCIAAVVFAGSASADGSINCDAEYEKIVADTPIDLASCVPEVASYTLDTCEPPSSFNATRPTSHLILAIDASGSMAGRTGGETKMQAAKREALAFLQDIPNEVRVSLVVYGHKGDNTESGKAASCAAVETLHSFKTGRSELSRSIEGLSPTGWTPIGGTLDYAAGIVETLRPPRDGDLAPVVYLISDGEETCDGDPVASAKRLYEGGAKTVVNTIGFAVDAETEAQLEAVAQAAGGVYHPAKDAKALRERLNAVKEAEAQLARYAYCVDLNEGKIAGVYHNAYIEAAGCFSRNDPTKRRLAVMRAAQKTEEEGSPLAVCGDKWQARARAEARALGGWISENTRPLINTPKQLIEAYRAEMSLEALKSAD